MTDRPYKPSLRQASEAKLVRCTAIRADFRHRDNLRWLTVSEGLPPFKTSLMGVGSLRVLV